MKQRRLPSGPSLGERLVSAIQIHQKGQAHEAAELYRLILADSPDHVDALHFLGVAEHQLGNSESALEHIGRALQQVPDHPDALNNRGNILKDLGRLDEAAADYRRALEIRAKDPNALSNLGTVLRAKGDVEGAVALFREVIAMRPDHAPAWQNLGNALADLDQLEDALKAQFEAMRLAPKSADSHRHLGAMLFAVGRVAEATEIYQRWLALYPDDVRAQHFVAACTGQTVPARASDDYVRAEFDHFANNFEGILARLEYQAPRLVAEEVARLLGDQEPIGAILDAGCGTGLCGPSLRPRTACLVGVDLSPSMIALARQRSLYDTLVVEELTAYLRGHEQTSDLIVSADTLVYFGDLGDVSAAAAKALRPGGVLVFTVERAQPEDAPGGYRIHPHGRYSHTGDYLRRTLAQAGFIAPSLQEVQLRKEAGKWVEGWLVSARVPAAQLRDVTP
jgi:predicted TPR repeat methyltransferase